MWHNTLWCNTVWNTIIQGITVCYNTVWYNTVWNNAVWHNAVWHNAVWHTVLWCDTDCIVNKVWNNTARHNTEWNNTAWQYNVRQYCDAIQSDTIQGGIKQCDTVLPVYYSIIQYSITQCHQNAVEWDTNTVWYNVVCAK